MRIVGSGAPTGNPGTWGYVTGGEARTAPRSCTGGTPLPRLGALAILAMPAPGQDAQATAGETPTLRRTHFPAAVIGSFSREHDAVFCRAALRAD